MKESFQFILDNYLTLKGREVDKNTKTYEHLVRHLPNEIKDLLPNQEDFIVKGSMGQGNKTDYPWIAIFNKNITTSAMKGLYIVYLFKKDMSGFYLTLNQGITNFENLYKKERYNNAQKVADYFRKEIGEVRFQKDNIYLGAKSGTKKDKLGYGYQKAVILQKYYPSNGFSDTSLKRELLELFDIYDDIVKHFDTSSYDQIIESVLAGESNSYILDAETAIESIKEAVDPDSDIPFGYYKVMEEVVPYQDRDRKYKRITNPKSGKINYLKKAKKDAETGLLGEKLALNNEVERLNALGLEDYAEKVKWISSESDSYGYDIVSYDKSDDGVVQEIYIEVKTTASKKDIDFFVTKNEVEKSEELDKRYCVYRIYDANSQNPKYYRVFGKIKDRFILDPMTFMARYKEQD